MLTTFYLPDICIHIRTYTYIQWALEQHWFELHGFEIHFHGNFFFFFTKYVLQYYLICGWMNLQLQNPMYRGLAVKLYVDFQLCKWCMPLTPMLFKGQLYNVYPYPCMRIYPYIMDMSSILIFHGRSIKLLRATELANSEALLLEGWVPVSL